MPATSPQTLLDEAKCFVCLGGSVAQMLRIAILVRTLNTLDPMAATDTQSLLEYGKCFNCYGALSTAEIIELALLDRISQNVGAGGGGGGAQEVFQGIVDPVNPPTDPTKPALYTNLETEVLWTWNVDTQTWI